MGQLLQSYGFVLWGSTAQLLACAVKSKRALRVKHDIIFLAINQQ